MASKSRPPPSLRLPCAAWEAKSAPTRRRRAGDEEGERQGPLNPETGHRSCRGVHADQPQLSTEAGPLDDDLGDDRDDQKQHDLVRDEAGEASDTEPGRVPWPTMVRPPE